MMLEQKLLEQKNIIYKSLWKYVQAVAKSSKETIRKRSHNNGHGKGLPTYKS